MEIIWHECFSCGDTIANQICYVCMESEVVKWLSRKNSDYVPSVKKLGEFFSSYFHEGATCVLCGANLNVCSKCYSLAVHKTLSRNAVLRSEFLDFASSKGFMLSSIKGVLNLKR